MPTSKGPECEACGAPSVGPTGRRRRFCSDRCRCWARLHPGERRQFGRKCGACGVSLDHKAAHARFCSQRCRDVINGNRRSHPVDRRTCGICGVTFQPRRRDQMGCCTSHGNQLSWRARRAWRRAVTKNAGCGEPFTVEQLAARLSMFAGCWMCGVGPKEHIDHVKPLARGGRHILANLRPACARCNRAKSDTWPWVA